MPTSELACVVLRADSLPMNGQRRFFYGERILHAFIRQQRRRFVYIAQKDSRVLLLQQ